MEEVEVLTTEALTTEERLKAERYLKARERPTEVEREEAGLKLEGYLPV